MVDPDRARQTLRAYADAFVVFDKEAWLSLFTDDAVVRDPAGAEPVAGRSALSAFWDTAHANGRRMRLDVRRVVACGAEFLMEFHLFVETPGKPSLLIHVCDVFRLADDGRILEMRAFWDRDCIQRL